MTKLDTFAGKMGMTPDDFKTTLNTLGILKKDGSPRKKLVDDGYFDSDGNIADYPALKELISERVFK